MCTVWLVSACLPPSVDDTLCLVCACLPECSWLPVCGRAPRGSSAFVPAYAMRCFFGFRTGGNLGLFPIDARVLYHISHFVCARSVYYM